MTLVNKSRIDPHLEQIRAWTSEGKSAVEIAKALGCSSTLVRQVMKMNGIARNAAGFPKGTKLESRSKFYAHADQIRRWTDDGWRIGRIAKELGCSKQTVWNVMEKFGIPRHPKHSCPGETNGAWKGGRYFDDDGYVLVYAPEHPHCDKAGRVREHRLVMESQLGRYLLAEEVVDHIDGQRANNDPSNLRVFASNREHLAATLAGRVPKWTEEGKERIRQGCRPRSNP